VEHEGDVPVALLRAGHRNQAEAVASIEVDLGDDDVEALVADAPLGLRSRSRRGHVVALLLEAELEEHALLGVRLDDEHTWSDADVRGAVASRDQAKRIDETWVEELAPELSHDLHRLARREDPTVGVLRVGREVAVGLGEREDARAERDLLALEVLGEAFSVPALVHPVEHRLGRIVEARAVEELRRRVRRLLRLDAMTVEARDVERGEVVGRRGLADVVEETRDREGVAVGLRHRHPLADLHRDGRDVRGVPAQLTAALIEQRHQDLHRLEVAGVVGRGLEGPHLRVQRAAAGSVEASEVQAGRGRRRVPGSCARHGRRRHVERSEIDALTGRALGRSRRSGGAHGRSRRGRAWTGTEIEVEAETEVDRRPARDRSRAFIQRRRQAAALVRQELRERRGVASVVLPDGGRDRGGSRDVGLHLAHARDDLDVLRDVVVEVRDDDRERGRLLIEHDGAALEALAHAAGHHQQGRSVDPRLREPVRAHEARLVHVRDGLEHLVLGHRVGLDQELDDRLAAASGLVIDGLVLARADAPVVAQAIQDLERTCVLGRRGGRAHESA